mmetsp:Transcript_34024/g.38658  ORF Transcript_34024/g.38658 Transcript_34024/m.38658 type:complete len:305 (-) Transcript_34024:84-998(-)
MSKSPPFPHLDVTVLAQNYNTQFFNNKLSNITIQWNYTETLSAGSCTFKRNTAIIQLSQKLLKTRSESNVREILLHEMIHAYQHITNTRDSDPEGHGTNFLAHMNRINEATGLNITIYHTFEEEAAKYLAQQYIWQCDGPCQHKRPYFGIVRRKINRAPSSRDGWWSRHQKTCSGSFQLISRPSGKGERSRSPRRGVGGSNGLSSSGAGSAGRYGSGGAGGGLALKQRGKGSRTVTVKPKGGAQRKKEEEQKEEDPEVLILRLYPEGWFEKPIEERERIMGKKLTPSDRSQPAKKKITDFFGKK